MPAKIRLAVHQGRTPLRGVPSITPKVLGLHGVRDCHHDDRAAFSHVICVPGFAVDYCRVQLPAIPGVPGSDYINASYLAVRQAHCCPHTRTNAQTHAILCTFFAHHERLCGCDCGNDAQRM